MSQLLPPLLVTGGPATGKTVTAKVLADTTPRTACLDVDDIRQLVKNGVAAPWEGVEGLLTRHGEALTTVGGDHLAAEWFGLTPAAYRVSAGWGALIDKATEPRATVIALGRLLAGCEKDTSRDSWRRVSPRTSAYLRFLAANGYDLSEVEKRAAGLTKKK